MKINVPIHRLVGHVVQVGARYFHAVHWPSDGKLIAPSLASKTTGEKWLARGKRASVAGRNGNVALTWFAGGANAIANVPAVQFAGALSIAQP